MSVPNEVIEYMKRDLGDVVRGDANRATTQLRQLHIDPLSEFAEFYSQYQGPFICPGDGPELLDLCGPAIPAIPDQTAYVRDAHGIPERFLALTTDESEGMFLYDVPTGAVFDVDFRDIARLKAGEMKSRWRSFNDFLIWYFSLS
jgi:hypothetical protein